MRRRMRFLRKARELAYRDLGGLVFDLHRFGRRNDALVLAKLDTIGRIDTELRALEATMEERRPVTVLREAGVAACPRCAAIHSSDDRFCPHCGLAMDLRAERPVAGPQSTAPAAPLPTTAPMPAPAPAMTPTATHAPPAAAPVPGQTWPPAPDTASPTPGANASPAPTPTPAPSSAPSPSPARAPMPSEAKPAPAAPASGTPVTPAQHATRPAGPASTVSGDPAGDENRANADQPTEIVRPPTQSS